MPLREMSLPPNSDFIIVAMDITCAERLPVKHGGTIMSFEEHKSCRWYQSSSAGNGQPTQVVVTFANAIGLTALQE